MAAWAAASWSNWACASAWICADCCAAAAASAAAIAEASGRTVGSVELSICIGELSSSSTLTWAVTEPSSMIELGAPKLVDRPSAKAANFSWSTWLMEYRTMNTAVSRVIMSAKDTSHRSWFSCSSSSCSSCRRRPFPPLSCLLTRRPWPWRPPRWAARAR